LQTSYEDMGMPISEQCLQKALNPSLSMWVALVCVHVF
jgi:hypothetical protein